MRTNGDNQKLKGVIPALTTPFKEDRSLDIGGYERLVEAVIGDGVQALVNGSATDLAVTDDERARFATAVRVARGRVPVVPAAPCCAPGDREDQAGRGGGCGGAAAAALAILRASGDGQFYREVMDASPLPV